VYPHRHPQIIRCNIRIPAHLHFTTFLLYADSASAEQYTAAKNLNIIIIIIIVKQRLTRHVLVIRLTNYKKLQDNAVRRFSS